MSPDVPSLECPRCGMVDQVQKVSAVVAAGAASSEGSGYTVGGGYVAGSSGSEFGAITTFGRTYQTGSQQTLLSLRLSPPPEPTLASAWPWTTVWGLVVFGVFASCSSLSACLIAGVINDTSVFLVGMLLTLPFIVAIVVLELRRRTLANRMREEWQAEHTQWQAEMANWDALYYCRRDDVVFFPGGPDAIPADSMWSVL